MLKYQEFREIFEVTDDDLYRIHAFGKHMDAHLDVFIERLYAYIRKILGSQFQVHFPDEKAFHRAQALAHRAWHDFLKGEWTENYVKSRVRIGEVHAQLQIDPRHYLGTIDKGINLLIELGINQVPQDEAQQTIDALRRFSRMESAVVVDVYPSYTAEIISRQSRSLIDMSTPITAIWDGILMLPVVGIMDSRRAQDIMHRMLEQIAEKRATVFILDISGVAVVDTAVANHLIRMTKAAHLMGNYTIVSGLSPSVAQTIVELGIEIGEMRTTGNLQDALRIAFDHIGQERTVERK